MTMTALHITVAAVVEEQGRFLMVEEETDDGIRINQPAGHLEADETLVAGAIREALEETAQPFTPVALLGIYRWRHPASDVVYLRFAFCGTAGARRPGRELDHGILRTLWMSRDELQASVAKHRSPLVLRCVDDYLRGQRFPLDLLVHYP
jgi:8-oxo-dGTP pyrophosphatase MutT (NUDIX family)